MQWKQTQRIIINMFVCVTTGRGEGLKIGAPALNPQLGRYIGAGADPPYELAAPQVLRNFYSSDYAVEVPKKLPP